MQRRVARLVVLGCVLGVAVLALQAVAATPPKSKPKPKTPAQIAAEDRKAGALLWQQNGCSSCHTLAAAKAGGRAAPNLDVVGLPVAELTRWITKGGATMPAMSTQLTAKQIKQLVTYIAAVARNRTARPRDARSLFQGYCGGCHALQAAGTNGYTGPSLDAKRDDLATVVASMVTGHDPARPFAGALTADEINRIAAYVVASAPPALPPALPAGG